MGLVTCNGVGNALRNWLLDADDEQRNALLNELFGFIKTCDESPLNLDTYVATCEQLNDAIENFKAEINLDEILKDPKVLEDLKELVIKLIPEFIADVPGNRIQIRDGKLAVIDEAPPNLSIQFVDSQNGNNGNDGTREKPLLTLLEALKRIMIGPGVGRYLIFLKAGQWHLISDFLPILENAQLIIATYDDPKYGDSYNPMLPNYYPGSAEDYKRATIQWRNFDVQTPQGNFSSMPVIIANRVEIYGVNLAVTSTDNTLPAWYNCAFHVPGVFEYLGGKIQLSNSHELGRFISATIRDVEINMSRNAKLLDVRYGPTLTMTPENDGAGKTVKAEGREDIVKANWPNREPITKNNSGFVFDKNGVNLIGKTNWELP